MISKLIVNKLEGMIDFVSEPDKGSTFFFTIKPSHLEGKGVQSKRYKKSSSRGIDAIQPNKTLTGIV